MWPDDPSRIKVLQRVVRLLAEQLPPERLGEVGGQLHDDALLALTELFTALGVAVPGDDLPVVEAETSLTDAPA